MSVTPPFPRSDPAPTPAATGFFYAVGAFLIWGLSPVYWKKLHHVAPFEIIFHRALWSFVFLIAIVGLKKQYQTLWTTLKSPRLVGLLAGSAAVISVNWFLFVWAINNDHMLETSLGYYICPLVNVLLGMIFLGERLRPLQWAALGIAATAVLWLALARGEQTGFPWIALFLAFSFGFYGLIRKVIPVSALIGLTAETLVFSLFAVWYLLWLLLNGQGAFARISLTTDLLLMGSALVTGLPLLLFTAGARMLHFTTLGFLQYIGPSCTFLLGVFVYKESMPPVRWFLFAAIWLALTLFSTDAVIFHYKRNH